MTASRTDDALRAAIRRTEDALVAAHRRVMDHGRTATAEARATAARATEAAGARAAREAARIEEELRTVVRLATNPAPGEVGEASVLPLGSVRVRRHTVATADVSAPLLVPTAGGPVRIVSGEDGVGVVLALVASLVGQRTGLRGIDDRPLLVVNPRRRPLPEAVRGVAALWEVHDGRGLLNAVAELAGAPGRLVVLDHPHDLGLAGRRIVQSAAAGGALRALLVHLAADDPDVDLDHRRLRIPRCGVVHPQGAYDLWPARGGWRWSAHPALRVTLPEGPEGPEASEAREASEAHARHGVAGGGRATPSREEGDGGAPTAALARYHELLDRLAGVARDHDAAVAAARVAERQALDRAAATRREAVVAIAAEQRTIELLLRGVGSGRAPPDLRPMDERPMRTVAPLGQPPDPRDLTPLRAARAALARAVKTASQGRGG